MEFLKFDSLSTCLRDDSGLSISFQDIITQLLNRLGRLVPPLLTKWVIIYIYSLSPDFLQIKTLLFHTDRQHYLSNQG